MKKAFVFGKFLPFHKGHEAMIRFALQHCDSLFVLICVSNKEKISGDIRKNWIEKTFCNLTNLKVQILDYEEDILPNTSVSSREVSLIWSEKFKQLFPDIELLVSSEPYGTYVAEYMNITHLAFDFERKKHPVSATAIRQNLFEYWHFLPDSVKPYFAIKVVILGTESTGKTTLANRLATHFKCSLVNEAGREIVENSQNFAYEDLEKIAIVHAQSIEKAMIGKSPLIIIDTDIHTTMSYSTFVFKNPLIVENHIIDTNKAQLYLYLNNDVSFHQDGTRFDVTNRNQLDLSHRKTLLLHDIPLLEISGDWENRFKKAVQAVTQLIKC